MRSAKSETIFQINELETHPITFLSLSKHIFFPYGLEEMKEQMKDNWKEESETHWLRGGFIRKKGRAKQKQKTWLLRGRHLGSGGTSWSLHSLSLLSPWFLTTKELFSGPWFLTTKKLGCSWRPPWGLSLPVRILWQEEKNTAEMYTSLSSQDALVFKVAQPAFHLYSNY